MNPTEKIPQNIIVNPNITLHPRGRPKKYKNDEERKSADRERLKNYYADNVEKIRLKSNEYYKKSKEGKEIRSVGRPRTIKV